MSPSKENAMPSKAILLSATIGLGVVCVLYRNRFKIADHLRYAWDFRNPLRHKKIAIVETHEECHSIVSTLKSHCKEYQVLGFDCEWVTVSGTRRPIAMLQLASHRGLCALIRLCNLRQIPQELRDLLENESILKVGVASQDDASHLCHDFGVGVASTLDLRFIAEMAGHKTEGLAKLSKSLLNVHLNKNWRLVCSDWEAAVLNEDQIEYAAKDALVAIEIFKTLADKIEPRYFWQSLNSKVDLVKQRCLPFLEARFSEGLSKKATIKKKGSNEKIRFSSWQLKKANSRSICIRARELYDNCLLQAPDGEVLCTIDKKKAQWYIDQLLGEEISSEPFTVRLNFEPAGRPVGEVGRYYQTPKENCCVVCGRKDAYIRKNIIPREYRTHFPVVMKSHTSHDILLLCPVCHKLSNISDLKIRKMLGKMCGDPSTNNGEAQKKVYEIPELRQLKSAARALLHDTSEKIPAYRRKELQEIVFKQYPNEVEITEELLKTAAGIDTIENNENFCPHGLKVVQYFKSENGGGGLIELEKIWREHFLNTMKPKFLPPLWSVDHNANRLEIRANEGRIDKADMLLAGLIQSILGNHQC